jgi:hypothetical protein
MMKMIKSFSLPIVLFLLLGSVQANAAEDPRLDEVMVELDVPPADMKKMRDGEVIAYERIPTSDTELGITLAFFVPVSLEFLRKLKIGQEIAEIDRTLLAYKEIPRNATLEDFRKLQWGMNEKRETAWLLKAKAGNRFNLSSEEIATFRKLSRGTSPEQVLATYQNLLFKRHQTFVKGGFDRVAPYLRGKNKESYPGREIRQGFKKWAKFIEFLPEFSQALLDYPQKRLDVLEEHFYIANEVVENRPTFVLGGRVFRYYPDAMMMGEAKYYVAHSYNGMLGLHGAFRTEKGVAIFSTNRTFTDQVAGFGGGMKRLIGLGLHKKRLIEDLQEIRKSLVEEYSKSEK